ncbi:MAG: metallophosphoesterase [candidate division Zixibacteria bacterium]|nr:metallophosphoesterase [candidate division Zixibacteria bacterium]
MSELFPVLFISVVLLLLSGLEIVFLRGLNRKWWNKRWIRLSSFLLPGFGIVWICIWITGIFMAVKPLMIFGATLAALTIILILTLIISLPVSGIINFTNDLIDRRKAKKPEKVSKPVNGIMPRRRFLKTAAAVVPIVSLGTGASGVAHAFTDIEVCKKSFYFKDLPDDLDGFKILHLSDIHIGYFIWMDKVEELLIEAQRYSPDIILATGDLCDRVDVYSDLLNLFKQFKTPYGVFASIGNHEYFRGIRPIMRSYEKTGVPLLKDSGVEIKVKNSSLYLAGADDPMFIRRGDPSFYTDTVNLAVNNASNDSFKILLSHRPNGFDHAAKIGIDLTLSGHTHGGQVGLFKRSAFDLMWPELYLWGRYQKGASQLYTSAGVGHWFPFRFNCPGEAPIIELRKGTPPLTY